MRHRHRWLLGLGGFLIAVAVPSAGATTFGSATRYPTGRAPAAIVVADLNADGNVDVATADQSVDTVSILLGAGNGTLQSAQDFSTGPGPSDIVRADFNGDGTPDLATANYAAGEAGSASVLLGLSEGGFQAPITAPTEEGTFTLATGDLNGDGKPDLVTANTFSHAVSVLLGNGDGTFAAARSWPTGDSTWPWAVTISDLDRDGKADLAIANYSTSRVSVMRGNGDGTFGGPTAYGTGSHPVAIVSADLNRDSIPDLVTADLQGDTASVLLGTGGSGFSTARSYPVGDQPSSLVEYPSGVDVADLDGDRRLDIAVDDYSTNRISVFRGNGDGTFQPAEHFATQPTPVDVAAGDFNADRLLDLATPNYEDNSLSVLLNTSPPAPRLLPDPKITPGVVNPAVRQSTISKTICARGWTKRIRPPAAYLNALKNTQLAQYEEAGPPSAYEEDHLIPLELGGAPRNPRNLWPEPIKQARVADRLERQLQTKVCRRVLTLAKARAKIRLFKLVHG